MLEMIAARRSSEKKEERFDLFTGLLDASDQDADGSAKLTDMELLSECPRGPVPSRIDPLPRQHLHIFGCRP